MDFLNSFTNFIKIYIIKLTKIQSFLLLNYSIRNTPNGVIHGTQSQFSHNLMGRNAVLE